MPTFTKITSQRGHAFINLMICLIIIVGACLVIYNNKDFQRANRKHINKINYYLRDYKKAYKDFTKDLTATIERWKESLSSKSSNRKAEKPLENRTFEELVFDNKTLERIIPAEMLRHQPDEITICAFNADFLFNNPLTDQEIIHLANVMRFCELSMITRIQNEMFLKRVSVALRGLRYNAVYEVSPSLENPNKTFYAYLYRDDKLKTLETGQLFTADPSIGIVPFFGAFQAGDFDFIVSAFATPQSGTALDSTLVLEQFYETLKAEHPSAQDIMIFGDFALSSRDVIWDSISLLPTIARSLPSDHSPHDLLGNFWFRKKDLVEFNGQFGTININENEFPSKRKPPLTGNKPLWAQFRTLPDDD